MLQTNTTAIDFRLVSYLNELQRLIAGQMPPWAPLKVIPRGLVIPLDPHMTGVARFAKLKSEGGSMPVLVPNNTAFLGDDLDAGQSSLSLRSSTLSYLARDYKLQLGDREIVTVLAPDPDTEHGWLLNEGVVDDYDIRERVYVWGAPCRLIAKGELDDQVLEFRSNHRVMAGDHLAVDAEHGAYREYEVVDVLDEEDHPADLFAAELTAAMLSDGVVTALSGATFVVTVDAGLPVVMTFPAMTSASDVPNEINNAFALAGQAPPASLTSSFRLHLQGTTAGSTGQIAIGVGTANSALNLRAGVQVYGQEVVYEFPIIYQVQLRALNEELALEYGQSVGLHRELQEGALIYLRGYPAYFSRDLEVPQHYWHAPRALIGPYALDACMQFLTEDPTNPTQTFPQQLLEVQGLDVGGHRTETIRLFPNEAGGPEYLDGDEATQAVVWTDRIAAEHLSTWKGSGGFRYGNGVLLATLNDSGYARLETTMAPSVRLPTLRLIATSEEAFRVDAHALPGDTLVSVDAKAPPGSQTNAVFSTAGQSLGFGGLLAESLAIEFFGHPGQVVAVRSLAAQEPRAASLRYRALMRGYGSYNWATSGLLLKPLFLSLLLASDETLDVYADGGHLRLSPVPCDGDAG